MDAGAEKCLPGDLPHPTLRPIAGATLVNAWLARCEERNKKLRTSERNGLRTWNFDSLARRKATGKVCTLLGHRISAWYQTSEPATGPRLHE